MLISIVGKSGSGKTTIAKLLESFDKRIIHIDVDKIAHYVLTIPEVKERIKKDISYTCIIDEEIQRKVLGKIVFSSPQYMDKLAEITWPYMEKIIDSKIQANEGKIIILDYLLLPKTKYFLQSDLRIWVNSPIEERFERIVKRGVNEQTISKEYFLKRDEAGINYEEGLYDIVINNSNKKSTFQEVRKVYEKSIISR